MIWIDSLKKATSTVATNSNTYYPYQYDRNQDPEWFSILECVPTGRRLRILKHLSAQLRFVPSAKESKLLRTDYKNLAYYCWTEFSLYEGAVRDKRKDVPLIQRAGDSALHVAGRMLATDKFPKDLVAEILDEYFIISWLEDNKPLYNQKGD